MHIVFIVLYVIVCVLLILSVLVQSGKGSGLSGLLGSSSSGDTVFAGGTGNMFLKKVTAVLAGLFVLGALVLTTFSFRQPRTSVVDKMASQMPQQAPQQQAPAVPAQPVAPVQPQGN